MVSKLRDLSLNDLFYYNGSYYFRRGYHDGFIYAIDLDDLHECPNFVLYNPKLLHPFDPDLSVHVVTSI